MDLKTAKILGAGGRAFKAVYLSKILTPFQKLLMSYLGSQLNFRGTFGESRWVSVATLMVNTSMSKSTVKRVMDQLVSLGYLVREPRFKDGRQLANGYRLTDLVFEQYAARLPKTVLKGLSIAAAAEEEIEEMEMEEDEQEQWEDDILTQPDQEAGEVDAAELTKAPQRDEGVNPEHAAPDGGGVHPEPMGGSTVDRGGVPSEPPYTPSESSLIKTPSFKGVKKGKYKDPNSQEGIGIARLLFNPGGHGRWVDIRAVDAWANDVVRRHGIETMHKLKDLAIEQHSLGDWKFHPSMLERCIANLGQRQEPQQAITSTPRQWVDMDGNIRTVEAA